MPRPLVVPAYCQPPHVFEGGVCFARACVSGEVRSREGLCEFPRVPFNAATDCPPGGRFAGMPACWWQPAPQAGLVEVSAPCPAASLGLVFAFLAAWVCQ